MSVLTAFPKRSRVLAVPDHISIEQHARIAQQVRGTTLDAEQLLKGREEAHLAVRLQPGAWNVAECLDHLTQTTRVFLPALAAAIALAPQLRKNRRLRTGLIPSFLIWNLQPPYRLRLRVLPVLAPQNPNPVEAWAQFLASQQELLEILRSAAGLAIDDVRIKSPVYARIQYNVYGAFRLLVAHQRRHLWQIEQILNALDRLPASGAA